MEEVLIPIVVVPNIFFALYMVIRTISDNNLRRKLIDKGLLDENARLLFEKRYADFVPNSLKWGMVLIALGSAILIGQLVPRSFQAEITVSGMFILGGLALVAYYFLATKAQRKIDEN